MEQAKEKIKEMLTIIGINAEVEIKEPGGFETAHLAITTDDARLLIGQGGQNLHSFEHILKRILHKKLGTLPAFYIDVNGYRMNRMEELREEARGVAKKVRLYRKEICLRPMNSFERRVVHTVLAEYPDITTESVGEDLSRAVVIKPLP
ncbi:MAG: hypothetical protein A3G49_03165 [Candidatus Sungbacteria bacterium RIFCSPLOWO2_12_FULL_41_11]|uniref:R3H domain-containing protein n=1 Tax=Candidatus Sungbacteria bacterium RIFCSPLOWO2_12_FULL_41_11 TaxID=1802286 RepID=A0A1G2LTN7_9BACT|nr:MAG: R3H domain protein [Parcubacteria group bacterium GW2011_GWA2_42_14]OGZ98064.1 MAG: hypothetical protein A3D41_05210 [Candidatus Sungbacteria bacterium RIFCSPHIGHO2_02_FULL_41_12b]OHA14212.1 MAG: hypothetical protein A3G49_03165 [Candidatus Sungbacteria bacterium RIFCSPLOWO2_12_FULL_41_11]